MNSNDRLKDRITILLVFAWVLMSTSTAASAQCAANNNSSVIGPSQFNNADQFNIDVHIKSPLTSMSPENSDGQHIVCLWARTGIVNGNYVEEFTPILPHDSGEISPEKYEKLKQGSKYIFSVNEWRTFYENLYNTISNNSNQIPEKSTIWISITVNKDSNVSAFVDSLDPTNDKTEAYANKITSVLRQLNTNSSLKYPQCYKESLIQVKLLIRDSDKTFLLENTNPTPITL